MRYQDFNNQLRGAYLAVKMKKECPDEIYESIYFDVGKKFNVSENTVKKWHQTYKNFVEPLVDLEVNQGFRLLIGKGGRGGVGLLYNPPR